MKLSIVLIVASMIMTLFINFSCKKSNSSANANKVDTVIYEAKFIQGNWLETYHYYSANIVGYVYLNLTQNYTTSFTIKHGVNADLYLDILSTDPKPIALTTANIYLNGKLIATSSDSVEAKAMITVQMPWRFKWICLDINC